MAGVTPPDEPTAPPHRPPPFHSLISSRGHGPTGHHRDLTYHPSEPLPAVANGARPPRPAKSTSWYWDFDNSNYYSSNSLPQTVFGVEAEAEPEPDGGPAPGWSAGSFLLGTVDPDTGAIIPPPFWPLCWALVSILCGCAALLAAGSRPANHAVQVWDAAAELTLVGKEVMSLAHVAVFAPPWVVPERGGTPREMEDAWSIACEERSRGLLDLVDSVAETCRALEHSSSGDDNDDDDNDKGRVARAGRVELCDVAVRRLVWAGKSAANASSLAATAWLPALEDALNSAAAQLDGIARPGTSSPLSDPESWRLQAGPGFAVPSPFSRAFVGAAVVAVSGRVTLLPRVRNSPPAADFASAIDQAAAGAVTGLECDRGGSGGRGGVLWDAALEISRAAAALQDLALDLRRRQPDHGAPLVAALWGHAAWAGSLGENVTALARPARHICGRAGAVRKRVRDMLSETGRAWGVERDHYRARRGGDRRRAAGRREAVFIVLPDPGEVAQALRTAAQDVAARRASWGRVPHTA